MSASEALAGTTPAAVRRASVLVVDDHALVRTGVANIISQEPDLQVVAEAARPSRACARMSRCSTCACR
jgi:DNA-binding NarL/FixJ family response regulator